MLANENVINIKKNNPISQNHHYRSGTTLFFSVYKRNFFNLIFGIICLFITAISQTLPAVLTSLALGELVAHGFNNQFLLYCFEIILISILFLITSFLGGFTFYKAAVAFSREIRQEAFDIIQNNSLGFHDASNSNQLLSKLINEVNQLRQGIYPSQRMIITAFFSFLLVLVFLAPIGSSYVMITIIGFAFYVYFAYRFSLRIHPVRENRATEIGELMESSQEIFRGIEVVRGNFASGHEKEHFYNQNKVYTSYMEKENKLQAFYVPTLIISLLTAVIFSMALIDFSKANLSFIPFGIGNSIVTFINFNRGTSKFQASTLIEAVALLLSLQMNTRMLPMAFLNTQAATVNARRIWEIMNWKDPYPDLAVDKPGLEESVNWKGDIRFNNVSFSYTYNNQANNNNHLINNNNNLNNEIKYAIKNLNVTIPGGSKVAVIGGPGAGKSTLLKLLLRLYDPQQGSIVIDNKKFSDIPSRIIRNHIARVEQELFLFSGSILENISFSKPDATMDQIIFAAKAAQAEEFIEEMPKKFDTIIGERGVTLSGGQRQRLGIARALLVNPEILLLDDSVSAIDSKTEYFLRKALDTLMVNRTTFTVTQRLVTLVDADYIMLFDKGNLIGFGNHKELIKTIPEYKRIFDLLPKSERVVSFDDKEFN